MLRFMHLIEKWEFFLVGLFGRVFGVCSDFMLMSTVGIFMVTVMIND